MAQHEYENESPQEQQHSDMEECEESQVMASDEQIMAMMDSGVYVPSAQAAAVRARCEAKESRADSSAVASARCTARVHADEDEPEFAASDARPLQSLRWFKAKHTGAKRKQGDALAAAVGTAELGGVEDFRSTVRLPTGAGERAPSFPTASSSATANAGGGAADDDGAADGDRDAADATARARMCGEDLERTVRLPTGAGERAPSVLTASTSATANASSGRAAPAADDAAVTSTVTATRASVPVRTTRGATAATAAAKQRPRRVPPRERRAAVVAQRVQEEEGGYTDKSRRRFVAAGGALITGNARTCLSDAVATLVSSVRALRDGDDATWPLLGAMRSTLEENAREQGSRDARFVAAAAFLRQQMGADLRRVTHEFQRPGGPELALLQAFGRLLVVQLQIKDGPDDKEPDLHCVAYDGLTLRDSYSHTSVKVLDKGDSASVAAARALFQSIADGCIVRIKNVYELVL
jgi:hypothetical protein